MTKVQGRKHVRNSMHASSGMPALEKSGVMLFTSVLLSTPDRAQSISWLLSQTVLFYLHAKTLHALNVHVNVSSVLVLSLVCSCFSRTHTNDPEYRDKDLPFANLPKGRMCTRRLKDATTVFQRTRSPLLHVLPPFLCPVAFSELLSLPLVFVNSNFLVQMPHGDVSF